MNDEKRRRIEAAGFEVFEDGCDALGLTEAEKAVVDARMAAGAELERRRAANPELSQSELARRMGTRQPAVSRLFRDPARASLETLVRALIALGADRRGIAALFL
jgi:transcriptional regulator with XRE-family HTH domain